MVVDVVVVVVLVVVLVVVVTVVVVVATPFVIVKVSKVFPDSSIALAVRVVSSDRRTDVYENRAKLQ